MDRPPALMGGAFKTLPGWAHTSIACVEDNYDAETQILIEWTVRKHQIAILSLELEDKCNKPPWSVHQLFSLLYLQY